MNILWLSTRLMYPLDNGGRIRTYHLLRQLSRNHRITIVTLADDTTRPEDVRAVEQVCERLITVPFAKAERFSPRFFRELAANLFSSLPYSISRYRSAAMAGVIRQQLQSGAFDLLVCDFLPPTMNMNLRDHSLPRVLFQHNQEATIWRRLYERQESWLRRRFFRLQWNRMRDYESTMCHQFDHVICVSEVDRDLLAGDYGVRELSVVPTGVDTEFFQAASVPDGPPELVFTGAMDWMPNEDGISFFAEQILPRIRARVPDVKVTIVGHNPPARLVAMSKAEPNFLVTGRVPDVRPYIARASGYIVPLRVGGGTRLKIYEAMAMGKAVISTPIGAEGLAVKHGENCMLSADAAEFADLTIQVLTNPSLRDALGRAARKLVEDKFDWKHVAQDFADICMRAAGRTGIAATQAQ